MNIDEEQLAYSKNISKQNRKKKSYFLRDNHFGNDRRFISEKIACFIDLLWCIPKVSPSPPGGHITVIQIECGKNFIDNNPWTTALVYLITQLLRATFKSILKTLLFNLYSSFATFPISLCQTIRIIQLVLDDYTYFWNHLRMLRIFCSPLKPYSLQSWE